MGVVNSKMSVTANFYTCAFNHYAYLLRNFCGRPFVHGVPNVLAQDVQSTGIIWGVQGRLRCGARSAGGRR